MNRTYRWIGVIAALTLSGGSAEAQFYGGGYWGGMGMGVGSTAQGSELAGSAMLAAGLGSYNLQSAQAKSINADTWMRFNQYMYEASVESSRVYLANKARREAQERGNIKAIRDRVRNNPTANDIADGSALNSAALEISDPKIFNKTLYYGSKLKLGGQTIRNIPFQYASAGISTSVHQLVNGEVPAALRGDEFGPDREKLKGLTAELRKEAEELGSPQPETIKKAKEQITATRAKIEATFPQGSQARRDADKYAKSLYGLASMLETPAINVLLAGVENRPDATVGDLLGFMSAYNLRFGAADGISQRQVYMTLYPTLAKLRDDVMSAVTAAAASAPPMSPAQVQAAPGEVFDTLGYDHKEPKVPPPPAPK
jgi:hypothetical protein